MSLFSIFEPFVLFYLFSYFLTLPSFLTIGYYLVVVYLSFYSFSCCNFLTASFFLVCLSYKEWIFIKNSLSRKITPTPTSFFCRSFSYSPSLSVTLPLSQDHFPLLCFYSKSLSSQRSLSTSQTVRCFFLRCFYI